jgi:hypothetical protein
MCNRILREAPTALGRGHSLPEFGSGALGGVGVFSRGKQGVAAGGVSQASAAHELEVMTDLSHQYFIFM